MAGRQLDIWVQSSRERSGQETDRVGHPCIMMVDFQRTVLILLGCVGCRRKPSCNPRVGRGRKVGKVVGCKRAGNQTSWGRKEFQEELMVTVIHTADKGWNSCIGLAQEFVFLMEKPKRTMQPIHYLTTTTKIMIILVLSVSQCTLSLRQGLESK